MELASPGGGGRSATFVLPVNAGSPSVEHSLLPMPEEERFGGG